MLVFLWWAGAGLSALVNIFHELGFEDIVVVDKYQSEITDKLSEKWIKVVIWDGIYNFSNDDIIIYSDAVVSSQDFQKVKNNRKFTYFQFVWEISKRFQTISIAGTHGKTSTTSMLISTLKKLDFEKFWLGIVGGFVADLDNKNYYINPKHKEKIKTIFEKILNPKWARPAELFKELYFVIEADEFNRHFLLLDTYIAGITKVDHDHKDVYPTETDYFETFKDFINKTRYKVFTNDTILQDNKIFAKLQDKIEVVDLSENIKLKYVFGEHMKKNALLVKKVIEEIIEITENFSDNFQKINKKDSSYEIIWLAMKLHSKLWCCLQENLYKKALKKLLEDKWFKVEEEKKINIEIDWNKITYGKADLVINNKIVLELKSSKNIEANHYKQLRKYIELWNFDYWLILNFWNKSIQFRRLDKGYKKLSDNSLVNSLISFKWVWRRQEYLGELGNVSDNLQRINCKSNKKLSDNSLVNSLISVYTDYAHHPVEIEATYRSFKENFPDRKLIWVFQPHQLFRFVSYEKDFIDSLKKFDEIYIYDIYSVREDNLLQELTWLDLPKDEQKKIIWKKIAHKVGWKYIENFDNLIKELENKEWIAIFMTAGDLDYKIRNYLLNSK